MNAEIKLKPKLQVITEDKIPHILEPGELGAILELIVSDKNGKVTEKRVQKSESFVRQFLEFLWIQALQVGEPLTYSVRDTGNTLRALWENGDVFDAVAGAGVVTHGIRVGTGSTPPTIDDYKLETPIAHGVGGGQLQYGGMTFGAPTSDAATSHFTLTRNFSNASGGDITVNEIGLYVVGQYEAFNYYYFMTIRDVIGGGIVVPNGQTLTTNYRIQAII